MYTCMPYKGRSSFLYDIVYWMASSSFSFLVCQRKEDESLLNIIYSFILQQSVRAVTKYAKEWQALDSSMTSHPEDVTDWSLITKHMKVGIQSLSEVSFSELDQSPRFEGHNNFASTK